MKTKFLITNEILRLVAEIDEFKGAWRVSGALAPERMHALKQMARIEAVGASMRMDGIKVANPQVKTLLVGRDPRAFRVQEEQEVAGYVETRDRVFATYQQLAVTENHIKQLHRSLLRYGAQDAGRRGEYKRRPNFMRVFERSGKEPSLVFETVSPFDVPERMEALVGWIRHHPDKKLMHPLLAIAIFVKHFLAIHPFQSGNGRLSGILTTLLLLQNGYQHVPYSSLESVIERNREEFYRALKTTQQPLERNDVDLNAWMVFFLGCLKIQKDNLAQNVERERRTQQLPALSRQILTAVKDYGQTTISEIQAGTKANRNTLKAKIRLLIAEGYLIKQGCGKGSWYAPGDRCP